MEGQVCVLEGLKDENARSLFLILQGLMGSEVVAISLQRKLSALAWHWRKPLFEYISRQSFVTYEILLCTMFGSVLWLMSWRLWELHADHAWHLYLLLRPLKGAASFNLHWNEMRWYEIFWYEMRRDWIRSFVVYAYSLWIFCIHKTKVDACVILIEPHNIRPCPFGDGNQSPNAVNRWAD